MLTRLCSFVLVFAAACVLGCSSEQATSTTDPDALRFRFGLVADIQYGDKPDDKTRRYKSSVERLYEAIGVWRKEQPPLDFAVQVGDIIDGRETLAESLEDLDLILGALKGFKQPFLHVLGNHCLEVPRDTLLPRLGLDHPYYAFIKDGWRFLMIDSLDFSTSGGWPEDSEPVARAQTWMNEHAGEAHAKRWNGGLREEQLAWIAEQLDAADSAGERVAFFSHLPANPAAGSAGYVLFNHRELLDLIAEHDHVVAYIAGHDHVGSYNVVDGVHYLTLPAMCDAAEGTNAFAIVNVYGDRLEVEGFGNVESRVLQ